MSQADGAAESDVDLRTLACVLDLVIPRSADGRMPGAGEVGVAAHIDPILRREPGLRAGVAAGVMALDAIARRRGAQGFAALASSDQKAVLGEVAAAQPGFLPGLIFHTYVGYYQAGRVLEGLGLEPRPPFPKGHSLEPFDLELLEPARRRGKLYRDV